MKVEVGMRFKNRDTRILEVTEIGEARGEPSYRMTNVLTGRRSTLSRTALRRDFERLEVATPWTVESTTWIEDDDYFPEKVEICEGTRASSSALRVPRAGLPVLAQQIIATMQPAQQLEADGRISSWHKVVEHLVFASCYDEDIPLIDAVLARLDELAATVCQQALTVAEHEASL